MFRSHLDGSSCITEIIAICDFSLIFSQLEQFTRIAIREQGNGMGSHGPVIAVGSGSPELIPCRCVHIKRLPCFQLSIQLIENGPDTATITNALMISLELWLDSFFLSFIISIRKSEKNLVGWGPNTIWKTYFLAMSTSSNCPISISDLANWSAMKVSSVYCMPPFMAKFFNWFA